MHNNKLTCAFLSTDGSQKELLLHTTKTLLHYYTNQPKNHYKSINKFFPWINTIYLLLNGSSAKIVASFWFQFGSVRFSLFVIWGGTNYLRCNGAGIVQRIEIIIKQKWKLMPHKQIFIRNLRNTWKCLGSVGKCCGIVWKKSTVKNWPFIMSNVGGNL